jgi:hypothetical protein
MGRFRSELNFKGSKLQLVKSAASYLQATADEMFPIGLLEECPSFAQDDPFQKVFLLARDVCKSFH